MKQVTSAHAPLVNEEDGRGDVRAHEQRHAHGTKYCITKLL